MGKNKYIGKWVEPESMAIDLPFTREALEQVLLWGARPETTSFCHRDIAHWCNRFWRAYRDSDAPKAIESLMPVLADVDCQWDLYLANTYKLAELQELQFDQVKLPLEWFEEWLKEVTGV